MPARLTPDSCEVEDDATQLDDEVFLGNTALVLGILLGIFLVHVTVISAVEAYWLAQVRRLSPLLELRLFGGRHLVALKIA